MSKDLNKVDVSNRFSVAHKALLELMDSFVLASDSNNEAELKSIVFKLMSITYDVNQLKKHTGTVLNK